MKDNIKNKNQYIRIVKTISSKKEKEYNIKHYIRVCNSDRYSRIDTESIEGIIMYLSFYR